MTSDSVREEIADIICSERFSDLDSRAIADAILARLDAFGMVVVPKEKLTEEYQRGYDKAREVYTESAP